MSLSFYKYQGTGNDFVVIDDRVQQFDLNDQQLIALICNRRLGVGADGLILLREHTDYDFEMIYFNANGAPSSMCGNGGRCIVQFAALLGLITDEAHFMAVDGPHQAKRSEGLVALQMQDVRQVDHFQDHIFMDTGSPHHITWVEHLENLDVFTEGRRIRNQIYGKDGANANFVEVLSPQKVKVRTYERGVEDETLSCGTGVTAVALAMHASGKSDSDSIEVDTPGGVLNVRFVHSHDGYKDVWLTGPAKLVFKGVWP